jgi:hypothetical protein
MIPTASGAGVGHAVIVSILFLLGAAFVFQGVADSGPQAHNVVLALLVGVVILLGMRYTSTQAGTSKLEGLTNYPWNPGG